MTEGNVFAIDFGCNVNHRSVGRFLGSAAHEGICINTCNVADVNAILEEELVSAGGVVGNIDNAGTGIEDDNVIACAGDNLKGGVGAAGSVDKVIACACVDEVFGSVEHSSICTIPGTCIDSVCSLTAVDSGNFVVRYSTEVDGLSLAGDGSIDNPGLAGSCGICSANFGRIKCVCSLGELILVWVGTGDGSEVLSRTVSAESVVCSVIGSGEDEGLVLAVYDCHGATAVFSADDDVITLEAVNIQLTAGEDNIAGSHLALIAELSGSVVGEDNLLIAIPNDDVVAFEM